MRLWLTLWSCVVGTSVDYQTWYSPIVLTGTCDEINSDGHCSTINVWYVYKGREKLPENVMVPKNVNGFETYVIHALDAQRVSRFGLHQTRILFGSVEKDTLVLNPQVSNVFLKNLERVSNLVRIQESNPEISPEELSTLPDRYDITFDKDAKMAEEIPKKPTSNKPVPESDDVAEPEKNDEPESVTTPIELLEVSTFGPEPTQPETTEPVESESEESNPTNSESVETEFSEPDLEEAETVEPGLIEPTTAQPVSLITVSEIAAQTEIVPEATEVPEVIRVTDIPQTTVATSADVEAESDEIVEITTKNYFEEPTEVNNEPYSSRSSDSEPPVDFDDVVSEYSDSRSSESGSDESDPMYPSGSTSSVSSSSDSDDQDSVKDNNSESGSSDMGSSPSKNDDSEPEKSDDLSSVDSSSPQLSSSDTETSDFNANGTSSSNSGNGFDDNSDSVVIPEVVSPEQALENLDESDDESDDLHDSESDGADKVLSFFPELQNFVTEQPGEVTEAPDQSAPKIFEPVVDTVEEEEKKVPQEQENAAKDSFEETDDSEPLSEPIYEEPVTAEAPTFPENESDDDFDRDDLSDDLETHEDDYELPTESPEYVMPIMPENSAAQNKPTTKTPEVAETTTESYPTVKFRTVFNVPTRVSWSDDLMDETSSLYLRTKAAIEQELAQSLEAAGLRTVNADVQGFKKKVKQHNKRHRRGGDSAIAVVEFSGSTDNPKNLMTELFEATDTATSNSNLLSGPAIVTSAIEWDETGKADNDEPQCTYGTWDDEDVANWTKCDCDVEGGKKYRTLKGFGENCPDKTEEKSCEEECLLVVYVDHSGDADSESVSDDSDDLGEASRLMASTFDDQEIEASGDGNMESSDDSDLQEGLFRATRDRYRRNIEEDLEDLLEKAGADAESRIGIDDFYEVMRGETD